MYNYLTCIEIPLSSIKSNSAVVWDKFESNITTINIFNLFLQVKYGGKVPEELYLRNQPRLLESDPSVTSLWVSARSTYNHSVVVRKKNSYIRVEFRTENGGIGFKMMLREFDTNNPE